MNAISERPRSESVVSIAARRTELEKQLTHAIRRAEQHYRQASQPVQTEIPSGSPAHLGTKVDLRA